MVQECVYTGGGGVNPQYVQHGNISGGSSATATIDLSKTYILSTCLKITGTSDRMWCILIDKGVVSNIYSPNDGNTSATVSGTTLTIANNNSSGYYSEYCLAVLN